VALHQITTAKAVKKGESLQTGKCMITRVKDVANQKLSAPGWSDWVPIELNLILKVCRAL